MHSPVTIANPWRDILAYLEKNRRLEPREVEMFQRAISETENRATLLGEHWYEKGKAEPRLF